MSFNHQVKTSSSRNTGVIMALQAFTSVFFPRLRRNQPDVEVCDDATSEQSRIGQALDNLCRLEEPESYESVHPIAAERVQRVAELLQLIHKAGSDDGKQWFSRARTYIILYNLACTHLMEQFFRDEKTELWLPYDEDTLPEYVQPP
jgi:hypothetical protein